MRMHALSPIGGLGSPFGIGRHLATQWRSLRDLASLAGPENRKVPTSTDAGWTEPIRMKQAG